MPSLKQWDGSAFVDVTDPRVWNGSALVQPDSAWIWDGTKFVKVWPQFVEFDAVGSGYSYSGAPRTLGASLLHTATEGAAVVVAVANMSNNLGGPSSFTRTATYGGAAMTSLGVIDMVSTYGWLEFFGLLDAPGGEQTVTAASNGTSSAVYIVQSVSYLGVASFGAAVTNGGGPGTLQSGSVPSTENGMVVQAFSAASTVGTVTISGYNQTSRYSKILGYIDMILGDAPGAATVNFSATSSGNWNSVAIPLLP